MTDPSTATPLELRPVVQLEGVRKSFGGVHALKGVDLAVRPATVIGLAGENGAGKSTLLKVLCGIYTPDAGVVRYDGVPQTDLTPAGARAAGVAAVAQELSLFEHLSVAENVCAGQEPMRGPFVDRRRRDSLTQQALAELGASIDPAAMVRDLPFADRQLVEIAKALVSRPRLLVLDEPTSGLREAEVDRLLETIDRLRAQGRSVVFITHRLSEMLAVCQEFTVLKDGESVATRDRADVDADTLVRLMVGRELTAMYPDKAAAPPDESTAPILHVRELSVPGTQVADVSFDVRPGEVVGVAGLAGHGQNELLEGIAGIRRARGELTVGTTKGPFATPRKALEGGVWLVPEDRKRHGLVLAFPVLRNLTLPTLSRFARLGFVQARREREAAERMVAEVRIRPADPSLPAAGLSGGNQQKVVIGRALLAEPDLYVFADPTRGIDVGTKHEIYVLLRRLTAAGKGVLLMSTDLNETIGVCDRVLVMVRGRVVAELTGDDLTEETVTRASFGEQVHAA